MPMHIGLGMDFGFGGGGGGGAHTSARLKCVWDRKCVCEAKKKSNIGQNYPVPTTRSMWSI